MSEREVKKKKKRKRKAGPYFSVYLSKKGLLQQVKGFVICLLMVRLNYCKKGDANTHSTAD